MRSILIFVDQTYEDLELWYSKIRMEEAGFKTVVAGPKAKETYLAKHGYPCIAEVSYEEVHSRDFVALLIPRGFSPDRIRRNPKALLIVKEMHEARKPIAFICHGGWVPISAKILRDKNVTGTLAIRDDLENAGAKFLDQPVVVDDNLISSRTPKDLPEFTKAIIKQLGQ